ncbi:hypothetical protein [Pyxidicoccus xibeiensis]|uniref:hypothetical protein n=1 Tax=Pyxidicoccus xibeiensis TaxID=2906759 RepID=UPI0020A80DAA|nr:hypothetical protein [Pyxidicoccus xibeiensis]MCP3140339.1 hypothetical protein [Pyxidicoccus xibeiensis]
MKQRGCNRSRERPFPSFQYASATMAVGAGKELFAYVYLDPAALPRQLMLQWRDGSGWEHRAYWGEDLIAWGTPGTAPRRYMGPRPTLGQ